MIYKESPHNILDAKITYFTECTPLAFSENYKGSFTSAFVMANYQGEDKFNKNLQEIKQIPVSMQTSQKL